MYRAGLDFALRHARRLGGSLLALLQGGRDVIGSGLRRPPPFVWEVQVRRELIEEELDYLRTLSYGQFQQMMARPAKRAVMGRDGKNYRIVVTAASDADASANIRVTVTLKGRGWSRSGPTASFVVTPDNQIL